MQRDVRKANPTTIGDRASSVVEDQNFYDFVSSTDRVQKQRDKGSFSHESRPSRGSTPSNASPTLSTSPSGDLPPSSLTSLTAPFRTSLGVELAHPLTTWIRSVTTPSPTKPVPVKETTVHPAPPGKTYTEEITYWNYIHPEVLASLQTGRQGLGLNHHDEHLFILVHQVFELWFKQILWELDYVRDYLAGTLPPSEVNPLFRANQRLARADKIMRLATEGYAIMETMDPQDFLEFRDFLSPSSGFQSVQLRELEILLGLKDGERIHLAGRDYREAFHANGDDKTSAFDRRLQQSTLKESLMSWLGKQDVPELDSFFHAFMQVRQLHTQAKKSEIEEELEMLEALAKRTTEIKELNYIEHLRSKVNAQQQAHAHHHVDTETFFNDPTLGKARKVALLLWTYQNHALYSERAKLCYGLLQFEQATLLWRIRHARMVELFIGRKMGTGGSSGVEYIDSTANQYRIFLDLWRIRSLGVARDKISTFTPRHASFHREIHHQDHHTNTNNDGDKKQVPLGVKNRVGLSIDDEAHVVGMKDQHVPVTTEAAEMIRARGSLDGVAPHPINGNTRIGGGCPFGFS